MSPFDVASLSDELKELNEEAEKPEVWSDVEKSKHVNQKIKGIQSKLDEYNGLKEHLENIGVLIELGEEEGDESLTDEVVSELAKAEE